MKFFPLFKHYPLSKLLLLSIPIMLFIHITALVFYTEEHKTTQHQVQLHKLLQKIYDFVYLSETIKSSDLDEAISAFNDDNFIAHISSQPAWPLRFNTDTLKNIQHAIPINMSKVQLSLQLKNNMWLNAQATITHPLVAEQLFLLILEAIIAVIIIFYVWSISRFTRPLEDFRQAAEQLGIDIHTPFPATTYKGPLIIRETARALKQMQHRIQDLLRDRTQMLAAISHDLRTPITRLKLRAHMMPDTELQQKTLLDLDEMETMISEILAFARGDFLSEAKVKIDLHSMLKTICDEISDMGKLISYSCRNKQLLLMARPISLKRAFINLIQNALKYGKTAHIHAKKQGQKIIITIDDKGSGIPENELKNVFTPFYRGDQSRSRSTDTGGSGLGLSISRDAILAHGGTVQLKNRPQGGLRATVTLFVKEKLQ